jgi:hypothetical protein
VANCSLQVSLEASAGTLAFCSCESSVRAGRTNHAGSFAVEFARLGGRGTLDVAVSAKCITWWVTAEEEISFTTPDQNGSCEPDQSMTVVDIGIFSASWPPEGTYSETADFDCNGTIDVVDVGLFAQGWWPPMGCGD